MTTIPFGELDSIAPGRGGRSRSASSWAWPLWLPPSPSSCSSAVGRGAGLLPAGSDGLVVLDLSASISSDTYARIGGTLDRLAGSGGRYGLIVFSDTAYLALPPGTPAAELRPFARRFDLPAQAAGAIVVPTNPWTASFSAGTKISTGLQVALDTIRARQLGRPAVLLVSDLDDDAGDRERLTTTGSRCAGWGCRFASCAQRGSGGRALHGAAAPPARRPFGGRATGEERGGGGRIRLPLLLAALAAAVALAFRELLLPRLERA